MPTTTCRAVWAGGTAAALGLLLAGFAVAQEKSVLLLHSGRLLVGQIDPTNTGYRVRLAGDASVMIPESNCRGVFSDKPAVYAFLAQEISPRDLHGHLELAAWCLREELPGQAIEQYRQAEALSPNLSEVVALRRRLDALRESAEPPPAAFPPPETLRPADAALAPDISAAAMTAFTREVQPLLVRRCLRCHDAGKDRAGSGRFPLRGSPWSVFPHKLTQANAAAVLEHCEGGAPRESRLWRRVALPHGGDKLPVDEPLLARVEAFVRQVQGSASNDSPSQAVAPASFSEPARMERLPAPPLPESGLTELPAKAWADKPEPLPGPETLTLPDPTPRTGPQPPRDPFDPEIFNRRFHGK